MKPQSWPETIRLILVCCRRKEVVKRNNGLITKEDESTILFHGFFYLIQELRSDCVYLSNKYAKIAMPSARFLNQIIKIRAAEV